MNYKDEIASEIGCVICPISFPEYVYCDEKCEECEKYKEFVKYYKFNFPEGS